jgi:hypothetical protein
VPRNGKLALFTQSAFCKARGHPGILSRLKSLQVTTKVTYRLVCLYQKCFKSFCYERIFMSSCYSDWCLTKCNKHVVQEVTVLTGEGCTKHRAGAKYINFLQVIAQGYLSCWSSLNDVGWVHFVKHPYQQSHVRMILWTCSLFYKSSAKFLKTRHISPSDNIRKVDSTMT